MADEAPDLAARIDAALTRIERAAAGQRDAREAIVRRHAALRERIVEAVRAIDDLVADSERA